VFSVNLIGSKEDLIILQILI